MNTRHVARSVEVVLDVFEPRVSEVAGKRRRLRRMWRKAVRVRKPWEIDTAAEAREMADAIRRDLDDA